MAVAWLFPGQGTQTVGMGKALAAASSAAREMFERADAALGWSLSELCFEGPKEKLTLTEHAQPAIVATSSALLAALREAHPQLPTPDFAAGHSLGEYTALVATGALGFEDAIKLVHLRGKAMQAAAPPGEGAMAAILGGDAAAVSELCAAAADGEVLSPANFNSPGQIVIAGTATAVARARAMAGDRKLKAIPLEVSAPFHCVLMEPAARAVERALADVIVTPPLFPVVCNVDALPNLDAAQVADRLVRQVASPVQWEQSIQHLAARGVTHALEIGAGKTLAGMVKRIAPSLAVHAVTDVESIARVPEFLPN